MENENSKDFEKGYLDVADNSNNLNSIELRDIRLGSGENDNQYNTEFIVKKTNMKKSTHEYGEFKYTKCKNVKSIFFNGEIFTSITNPTDDLHALYIKKNKKGVFEYNFVKDGSNMAAYQTNKREILKEQIDEFILKINSIIEIGFLNSVLRKLFLYRVIIYMLMIASISLMSYFTFFIMINFISYSIGNKTVNETAFQKVFAVVFVIINFGFIFYLLKLLKDFKLREVFSIFTYILAKKRAIEIEIEYWNSSIFHPSNMKAQLAETFDYIQIFYDKKIVYEMEKHDFNNY